MKNLDKEKDELNRRWWIWPHLLSVDAPLVAVVWQLLFARTLHIPLRLIVAVLTGLVTWVIYLADRLLDTLRGPASLGEPTRHQFYRVHRDALLPLFLAVLAVTCGVGWQFLGLRILKDGLILMGVVGLYFAVVHIVWFGRNIRLPKEMAVAILFGMGTTLPVTAQMPKFSASLALCMSLFVATLWVNAVLIESTESHEGQGGPKCRADHHHISTDWGGTHQTLWGACLATVALASLAFRAFGMVRPILVAVVLSVLGLALLNSRRGRVSKDAFRVLADTVLLIPGLLLPFLRS